MKKPKIIIYWTDKNIFISHSNKDFFIKSKTIFSYHDYIINTSKAEEFFKMAIKKATKNILFNDNVILYMSRKNEDQKKIITKMLERMLFTKIKIKTTTNFYKNLIDDDNSLVLRIMNTFIEIIYFNHYKKIKKYYVSLNIFKTNKELIQFIKNITNNYWTNKVYVLGTNKGLKEIAGLIEKKIQKKTFYIIDYPQFIFKNFKK